jgi:hypothetical protein
VRWISTNIVMNAKISRVKRAGKQPCYFRLFRNVFHACINSCKSVRSAAIGAAVKSGDACCDRKSQRPKCWNVKGVLQEQSIPRGSRHPLYRLPGAWPSRRDNIIFAICSPASSHP